MDVSSPVDTHVDPCVRLHKAAEKKPGLSPGFSGPVPSLYRATCAISDKLVFRSVGVTQQEHHFFWSVLA